MNSEPLIAFVKEAVRIAAYPVGAVLVLSIVRSFWWWGFVILGVLILIAVAIATNAIMVLGAMAVWRRDWRKIAIWATALVLAVPAILAARTTTSGDYVHLAIMYPYYAMQPEYQSNKPFSVPWTNEGFLLTQGCDRSLQFDPSGKAKAEERRVVPDAYSYYYNWLSVRPLFMKFSVREDCYF